MTIYATRPKRIVPQRKTACRAKRQIDLWRANEKIAQQDEKVNNKARILFNKSIELMGDFYYQRGKVEGLKRLKGKIQRLINNPNIKKSMKERLILLYAHIVIKNNRLAENHDKKNLDSSVVQRHLGAYWEIKRLGFFDMKIVEEYSESHQKMINILNATINNVGIDTNTDAFVQEAIDLSRKFPETDAHDLPIDSPRNSSSLLDTPPLDWVEGAEGVDTQPIDRKAPFKLERNGSTNTLSPRTLAAIVPPPRT